MLGNAEVRKWHFRRLRIEPLEDRRMLAAVTVTNDLDVVNGDTASISSIIADDGGDGVSLREAILATNSQAGNDNIDFISSLDGGSINLDAALLELLIQDHLTIDAVGLPSGLTVDAGQQSIRVLQINNQSTTVLDVTLRGLTITGGDAVGSFGDGGGVYTRENLTLENVAVIGNAASRDGGGINLDSNDGANTLTLVNSIVSNNAAGAVGGGIEVDDNGGTLIISGSTIVGNTSGGDGGGILHDGVVSISNSTIENNHSGNHGGGIYTQTGSGEIVGSTIEDNTAVADGGGIFVHLIAADMTIRDSEILANEATDDGGGVVVLVDANSTLTIDSTSINGNRTLGSDGSDSNSGGLAVNSSGTVEIIDSEFLGNSTTGVDSNGGGVGILNFAGTTTIRGTTIATNSTSGADSKGGGIDINIHTGSVIIEHSTIAGNSAVGNVAHGGGIHATLNDGTLLIENSTLRDNDAGGAGGGLALDTTGGASGDVEIVSSSVHDNRSTGVGGGIWNTATLSLHTSIISYNRTSAGANGAHGTSTSVPERGGDSADGGGIYNSGSLNINHSRITGNVTGGGGKGGNHGGSGSLTNLGANGGDSGDGGAIFNAGSLVISDSTIQSNETGSGGFGGYGRFPIQDGYSGYSGRGGAIYSSGTLTITTSSIDGNRTGAGSGLGHGGGVFSAGGDVDIAGSTISGNLATAFSADGGGIYIQNGSFAIRSSTISGNGTSSYGGGICLRNEATGAITHSTITGNDDEGIEVLDSASLNIQHTIVAANVASDVNGAVTASFSLIGEDTDATITDNGGNLIGTSGATIDPLLTPLINAGGPTKTHVPITGSPAIDAGDPNFAPPPDFDQRGAPFDRLVNFSGGGARVDIGAHERQATVGPITFVVDTLDDAVDGDLSPGHLSMREAISLANAHLGAADAIEFDASLDGGTIQIGGGELTIADSLTINAANLPNGLTLDASVADATPDQHDGSGIRILGIDNGDDATLIDVQIVGLTFTGGDTAQGGGAIRSFENLSLHNVVIADNASVALGGGIHHAFGTLALVDSEIAGNETRSSAPGSGGGIAVEHASAVISGSSIVMNRARANGGGIDVAGSSTLTVIDSLIANNDADFGSGGGVHGATDTVATIHRSTISGNKAFSSGGGLYFGGDATISESTVADNEGNEAVLIRGDATLTHVTISDSVNFTDGISLHGANASIFHSTIAGNRTGIIVGVGTSLALGHTIVANNGMDLDGDPVLVAFYNLVEAAAPSTGVVNGFNGNRVGVDPLLAPLADNGGPTLTHGLLAGSPAIDRGDPTFDPTVFDPSRDFDQRGAPFVRVFDGDGADGARIDIGALESQPTEASLPGDYNHNGVVDAADYTVWRDTIGQSGIPFSGADGDGSGTVDSPDYSVWKTNFGQVQLTPAQLTSTPLEVISDIGTDRIELVTLAVPSMLLNQTIAAGVTVHLSLVQFGTSNSLGKWELLLSALTVLDRDAGNGLAIVSIGVTTEDLNAGTLVEMCTQLRFGDVIGEEFCEILEPIE